jgi:hypothetical protein
MSLFKNKLTEALGKFEKESTGEFVVSGILSQAPQTTVMIKVKKAFYNNLLFILSLNFHVEFLGKWSHNEVSTI